MSGFKFGFSNIDGDENLEDDFQIFHGYNTRDGLIFLVDCTADMFTARNDEDSPFSICMKCAKTTIQNKIISSDKDLIGVVFFGTEKSNTDFSNVFVYQDLEQPSAQQILSFESFLESGINNVNDDYGHSQVFSLSQALWACSNLFSKCKQNMGFKRVMLFTNNDDPHANSQQLQDQARTKARDLNENGIDLELLPLCSSDANFSYTNFYKDLIFNEDADLTELPDPSEKLDELLTRVRAKDHKKRAMARLNFSMADGFDMAVGLCNLVGPCLKPYPIKLLKKTNEELRAKSTTLVRETGEVLGRDELKRSHTYAGRQICFEVDEITQVKSFFPPGLLLMGFKPSSKLKPYYHVRPSHFIHPDEERIKGSTTLFTALLCKCIERDVLPVCRFIPRKNTPPRFVMLLPQKEELDEKNVQMTPPGFHVIYLPFTEDFRQIPIPDTPTATTEQIDKAKEIIKKLKFKYSPDSFENPVFQHHWRNIEALALDRDQPDEFVDHTIPDYDMMERRAGTLMREFKELVFPDGYDPKLKRKATGSGTQSKRAKIEPTVTLDIRTEWEQGRLGKLTVPVLKDFVKSLNITLTTNKPKKADLVTAIDAYFNF